MKTIKKVFILVVLATLTYACEPDRDDYTEDWVGEWKTTEDTKFPQTKYLHQGTIVKDNSQRNRIILSGTILGINSSYQIPIKLSSDEKGSIDYTNGFTISGTAKRNVKDTITLQMTISQENKSESNNITLIRVK